MVTPGFEPESQRPHVAEIVNSTSSGDWWRIQDYFIVGAKNSVIFPSRKKDLFNPKNEKYQFDPQISIKLFLLR